jgi:hypothetical protein
MPDERSLRDSAREEIQNGRLPARPPICTLGGGGSGERCVLCGETIGYDQMEVELEFAERTGDTTEIEKCRFHPPVLCRVGESPREVRRDVRPPLETIQSNRILHSP